MKRGSFAAIILLLILSIGNRLDAFGKKEAESEQKPVNPQWVLGITAIDTSALPSQQVMGEMVARNLANNVSKLHFRFRGEEESFYYRDLAWAKSRADTAKALQTKRNERDLLLFRGDRNWKYRKNLRTVDDAILKLEADLERINANAPVVEDKPVFMLASGSGNYPKPPEPGTEYQFCTSQKIDAFLSGNLSEYHGRIFLTVRMYTIHTRSFSFEESILFSLENLNEAIDEISGWLAIAVSDALPSAVLVHVSPPEAMALIDGSFAVPDEMHFRSPGETEITVRADNFVPYSVSAELNTGELTEFFINLSPLSLAAFEATVPNNPGSKVYLGSLYVGEAPLTLELPGTSFAYISVETPQGEIGSMVYRDNSLIKGNAQFTRITEDGSVGAGGSAAFTTKVPISPEEKRVDRARRGFYGAYGAFWIILPVSLLTAGIAQNYVNANNMAAVYGMYADDYDTRKKIYDNAVIGRNVTIGAYGVMGVALGVTFFQIFRYLYVSGGDATPIVKHNPSVSETEQ